MPTGKVSWFGGPQDSSDSGRTASGGTTATPGVALYNRSTLGGYWRVKFPNGRTLTLRQTDIGPAPWTGRKVDVTYSALRQAGYTTGNFPTDSNVQYSYLGKNPPKGGTSPQQAAQGGSGANTTVTKTITPGVDNSAVRKQLMFQYLSQPQANPFSQKNLTPPAAPADPLKALTAAPASTPDPAKYLAKANMGTSSLLNLAGGLQQAQDVAPVTKTVVQRQAAQGGGGGGGTPNSQSGAWADHSQKINGYPVSAPIYKILQEAKRLGWRGSVTSGYRSNAEQEQIYASGVRPAAVPGTSMHEFGRAVDVTDMQSLANLLPRIAQKYPWARGFQWAGSKDPPHFSWPKGVRY